MQQVEVYEEEVDVVCAVMPGYCSTLPNPSSTESTLHQGGIAARFLSGPSSATDARYCALPLLV